jgi:NitT/TauT family transport system substrate-binding protein
VGIKKVTDFSPSLRANLCDQFQYNTTPNPAILSPSKLNLSPDFLPMNLSMFKIPSWMRSIGLALMALTFAISCTQQPNTTTSPAASTATSSQPLTSATVNWIGHAGHYVALKKDLFTEAGIKVNDAFYASPSEMLTGFLSGKADIAWLTNGDTIQAVEKDPTVKIIYLVDYSNGADGIIGRNIKSPQDLKGKTIARENVLFEKVLLQEYLGKAGLTEKDVIIKDLPAGDAATAFAAKKVDAAVTFEPYLSTAAKQGGGELLFSTKGTNIIADVIAVRANLIQTRKADLQAYLKAVDKAVKLVNTGDAEALKIVADKMGIKVEEVKAQLPGATIFDIAGNKTVAFNPSNPNNMLSSLEAMAKVAIDSKLVAKPIDAKSMSDGSIVESL